MVLIKHKHRPVTRFPAGFRMERQFGPGLARANSAQPFDPSIISQILRLTSLGLLQPTAKTATSQIAQLTLSLTVTQYSAKLKKR